MTVPACTIKTLPTRLHGYAAEVAAQVHPGNASAIEPQRIGVITTKYWGPQPRVITVAFLEPTAASLRSKILAHMNAWADLGCSVSFAESSADPVVRISRAGSGYWSYLGTDILHVPANQPTMNLQGFVLATPDSEYRRVVRHETGHTMGFPHEHLRREMIARLDPQKTYNYFAVTQGWDAQTTANNVLTPVDESSIRGTPADEDSVMCYQLPGSITRDGRPIRGGADINERDATFARVIYQPWDAWPEPDPDLELAAAARDEHHWPEGEDVRVDLDVLA
jgi:hypothetical protein